MFKKNKKKSEEDYEIDIEEIQGKISEDGEKEKSSYRFFLGGFIFGGIVMMVFALFVNFYQRERWNKALQDYISSSKTNVSEEGEKSLSEVTDKMKSLQGYIDQYFLFDEDYSKLGDSVYKAMFQALDDPYSCYYTADEYKAVTESTSGKYVGIGAVVQKDEETGYIRIVSLFDGSGAKESGIRPDDLIMEVSGESTVDMELSTAAASMKGEEGTTVDIKVKRPSTEETLTFTVTRKKVETVTVAGMMLEDYIGYIVITEFDEVTVDQFKTELEKLTDEGIKGLVVDLRNNPGGLLTSVNSILDELLPEGLIVYTEDKYGNRKEYNSDSKYNDVPLAVLVNGNSASASEIFAGAMKDYKRATLVGTQTFGKGIVQTSRQLSDGSAVKLTVSRYYTPNGICIHGEGITPDIVVELDENYDSSDENTTWKDDNQLKAAFDALAKK